MSEETTNQETELSPFLQHQKILMENRARQDADIAEQQARRIAPVAAEQNKQILPQQWRPPNPPRLPKPEQLTFEQIREKLNAAGNAIADAEDQFAKDTASLDAFFSEQTTLKLEIAELQKQLAEKQARLDELESQGSPKEIFLKKVITGEQEVAGYAGLLFAALSEQASQNVFGVSIKELSYEGRKDVELRFRKVFGRFTNGSYLRLGRQAQHATAETISRRADELLNDLEFLITNHLS